LISIIFSRAKFGGISKVKGIDAEYSVRGVVAILLSA
jgi:hypothetical protein